MPKTIAIIPARGGSKRIPRKNLVPFNGVPLLVHSIRYGLQFPSIIDAVIVSTEDEEIASVAKANGAEVIMRPNHLSSDTATTLSVLQDVLEQYGSEISDVILLQATNPLRPKDLLSKAWDTYKSSSCESLMTVSRVIEKLGKIEKDSFVPFNYEMGQRSQDLEALFKENGLLYITQAQCIEKGSILGANNYPYEVTSPWAEIDIDTPFDLQKALLYLKNFPEDA